MKIGGGRTTYRVEELSRMRCVADPTIVTTNHYTHAAQVIATVPRQIDSAEVFLLLYSLCVEQATPKIRHVV
jgi:hypothetical protein